ncbi:hypothetical protein F7734_57195 [Scytonema sp. UIC 10036]|uniref:hypothetical protein n=1 Tax=Scytonema sp. UIC 10036 TaxID=2304196 RepID=UPI0012DA2411|nr:hypothetical protein [Scytonema sp. UIC 10036]MUH01310.1 hypothetical protein [Scytonema sp. UIC 10036]
MMNQKMMMSFRNWWWLVVMVGGVVVVSVGVVLVVVLQQLLTTNTNTNTNSSLDVPFSPISNALAVLTCGSGTLMTLSNKYTVCRVGLKHSRRVVEILIPCLYVCALNHEIPVIDIVLLSQLQDLKLVSMTYYCHNILVLLL